MTYFKFRIECLRDLIKTAVKFAWYVPLWRLVEKCERLNIRLPFFVINAAVNGERSARLRAKDIPTLIDGVRHGLN